MGDPLIFSDFGGGGGFPKCSLMGTLLIGQRQGVTPPLDPLVVVLCLPILI